MQCNHLFYNLSSAKCNVIIYFVLTVILKDPAKSLYFLCKSFFLRFTEQPGNELLLARHSYYFWFYTFFIFISGENFF